MAACDCYALTLRLQFHCNQQRTLLHNSYMSTSHRSLISTQRFLADLKLLEANPWWVESLGSSGRP